MCIRDRYARENLTGLRVIRAFAREDFQEKKFASENAVYADNSSKLFKLTGLTEPLFVQIIIAMIVAIVWFALEPLGSGTLAIGDLVAFIEYSFHALLSLSLIHIYIVPVYKMVDTCAAEFESSTPYFYSTYEWENESIKSDKESVIVLGSGPIRIGQGVEFDYATVHSCLLYTSRCV